MKLKKLVGDKNKSIINYFNDEETAVNWIQNNIANPRAFELFELKGIISDVLSSEEDTEPVTKSATEMLDELGYKIVKTKSLTELENLDLKSWFEKGDAWCKYNDAGRWSSYDIFLIWKPDAKDMKPLPDPKVDDEYSLSLMSLGCKDGRLFQICQRYNHSAKGSADWALGGNLDNLATGLTEAFCEEFGYESLGRLNRYMPEDTIIRHGKYIKYNYEINDVYFYGEGVCTSEGFMYTDTARYTIVDYFVVDWVDKKVINPSDIEDGFLEPLQEALTNGDLKITKIKD